MGLMTFAAVLAALAPSQGVANNYWAASPSPCAKTNIELHTRYDLAVLKGLPNPERVGIMADSNLAQCNIRIAWDRIDDPWELCNLVIHEEGHIRGVVFPDNPTDPQHSNDPHNVMFWNVNKSNLMPPIKCMKKFPPPFVVRQHNIKRKFPHYKMWKCVIRQRYRDWYCTKGINSRAESW
jgi:hypothetical protein